jgi:hypothetical protein
MEDEKQSALMAQMYSHILKIDMRTERTEDKVSLVDKKFDKQAVELVDHRHRIDRLERNSTKIAENCGVRGAHEAAIEVLRNDVDTLRTARDVQEAKDQRKQDRRVAWVATLTSTGVVGIVTLVLKLFKVV